MIDEPRTFAALAYWYRGQWSDSMPLRLHVHELDYDVLGSPRWTRAFQRYLLDDWGATGWDRNGDPRGVDEDGTTIDRFRFYLALMLRRGGAERRQAERLCRWAYLGWDMELVGLGETPPVGKEFMETYLERALRNLWRRCQAEPVRYSVCSECRRRDCVCGEKSESQRKAEEAGKEAA